MSATVSSGGIEMPIKHSVDVEKGLMLVHRWGDISTQDEIKACQDRARDPLVVPGIKVLVDCTEVDPPDSTETIKYIADCSASLARDLVCGPVAIVVSSDVEYGMARMYMAYTDLAHPDTQVFLSREEALKWLDAFDRG